ncbi:hypothetical protein BU24DRAFT_424524 [Aaosphaeria arxii CBS 175.79]|uniref:Uncharacterized protein n=1 Tax=Aaosphaeria arxii CBS 175.79 TaxID=1450172 RepID=A0A6A5XJR5_9PLEO|nr:uncharacterized protein BU24DRAFT_424524 [Aaosphaeria arxii CBS 175.79]KAF2013518.1 hypothetical protein BU24DRAFT_424524 [Aaosphaeria arxii CBS 175.79]
MTQRLPWARDVHPFSHSQARRREFTGGAETSRPAATLLRWMNHSEEARKYGDVCECL